MIINVFHMKLKKWLILYQILLGFGACWHDVVDYGVTQYKGSKQG